MRLDDGIKNGIIIASKKHFGDASLYLFGSRVDDNQKGGDIDLFVESNHDINLDDRHDFLTDVYRNITERSIDLIIKTPNSKKQKIFSIAKETGIKLC
jgi:predicted nucleotidyltransferase